MAALVMVFSGKDLPMIQSEGGSGHWIARINRVEEAEYVVCVRNRRETWAAKDCEHGTAFLVGRIAGTLPSEHDNRIVIAISEYAEIHVPDAWSTCTGGQRYPVAYLDADVVAQKLNINFDKLNWKPLMVEDEPAPETNKIAPLTIMQAKQGLAKAFDVDTTAIEITIRS
jgi:hypothetical protein